MPRPKKVIKAKEPVRIRFKELQNGNKSIYLDIYRNGKRTYEFLKLYLVPEIDPASRAMNQRLRLTASSSLPTMRKAFPTRLCVAASNCRNFLIATQGGWRTTASTLQYVVSIPYGKQHTNSVAMFLSE